MLIIQNDPAGVTGRARYPLDCSISLQANIDQHLQSGHSCTVAINGVEIDPLTDARMDMAPLLFDHVVVTRRPEGLEAVAIAEFAGKNYFAGAISAANSSVEALKWAQAPERNIIGN